MNWIEALTIIGTGFTVCSVIYTIVRNFKVDINTKFQSIEDKFEKMDKRVTETNKRMDGVYHILLKRIGEEK